MDEAEQAEVSTEAEEEEDSKAEQGEEQLPSNLT
jgi:hypothetical protein